MDEGDWKGAGFAVRLCYSYREVDENGSKSRAWLMLNDGGYVSRICEK